MSARFFLTPAARRDLVEINAYLRRDSPAAAATVRSRLRDAMVRLANGLVWVIFGKILRTNQSDSGQIIGILHGARNIAVLLAER